MFEESSSGRGAMCSRRRDGTIGSVCVYEAIEPRGGSRITAAAAGLPVDEIVKVADTSSCDRTPPRAAA